MGPEMGSPRVRNHLPVDALLVELPHTFADVPDPLHGPPASSLAASLMAAFALFSLQDPSLLAFEALRHERNLKTLYGLDRVPCGGGPRCVGPARAGGQVKG